MDNRRKDKYFEEEVDDDEFLRHSKTGSGYLLPSTQARTPAHPPASGQQGNSFGQAQGRNDQTQDLEKQRQLLAERRRDIEERTLASSERGLGLLYESEKVGAATADELSRQKEQLVRTEQGGESEAFSKRAIESLVKKIKEKRDLITVITSRLINSIPFLSANPPLLTADQTYSILACLQVRGEDTPTIWSCQILFQHSVLS